MHEVKLCYAINIFLCVYLITIYKCTRRDIVKLLYYIQLNKEISYNYLVYLLIILTKLRLTVTINKKGFMKSILNYQEQTSYWIMSSNNSNKIIFIISVKTIRIW